MLCIAKVEGPALQLRRSATATAIHVQRLLGIDVTAINEPSWARSLARMPIQHICMLCEVTGVKHEQRARSMYPWLKLLSSRARATRASWIYVFEGPEKTDLRRQVVLTAAAGSLLEWTQDLDP